MTVTVRLDGNRATCEIYICDLKSCLMKNPRLFYIILSALLLLAPHQIPMVKRLSNS